jgi:hypothetical protein
MNQVAKSILDSIRGNIDELHSVANRNDVNNQGKSETNELTVVKKLLMQIEEEILGEAPKAYQRGREIGTHLVANPDDHIRQVAAKYDSLANLLSDVSKRFLIQGFKEAKIQVTVLEERIKKMKEELDESKEGSVISRINKKIEYKEKALKDFEEDNFSSENQFVKLFYEVYKKRLNSDLTGLDGFESRQKEFDSILTEKILNFYNKEGANEIEGQPETALDQGVKVPASKAGSSNGFFNRILSFFGWSSEEAEKVPHSFVYLNDANTILNQNEERSRRREDRFISSTYDAIFKQLREHEPIIPPRSLIMLNYFIATIILLGEVYLVYEVLTDVLNFDVPNSAWGFINPPIRAFILVFCLAYPLSIGMMYKFGLKKSPGSRDKLKDKLSKSLMPWIYRSLFLMGIVASLKISKSRDEIGKLLDKLFFEDANQLIEVFETVAIGVFLPVITLVFATVGSIMLVETMMQHKQFRHMTKSKLISFNIKKRLGFGEKKGETGYMQRIREEIKELNEKIQQKRKELNVLEDEYIRKKAYAESEEDELDFSHFTNTLKSIAEGLFLSGYEAGRVHALQTYNETDLIVYLKKRKYLDQ